MKMYKTVTECQICGSKKLEPVLSLGYAPPVNQMASVSETLGAQLWFPTDLLHCTNCDLVQLGGIVSPEIVFPPDYPYTSGTTKALLNNFMDLSKEVYCRGFRSLETDLVVDIGSNDGSLLSFFPGRRLGVEPTDIAKVAKSRGILTKQRFFNKVQAERIFDEHGHAQVITCTNCFAHIDNVHDVMLGVKELLAYRGVFVTESHYLMSLIQDTQYDTIYHEHLRYYSLTSLAALFQMHGMEIIHAKKIPTHGGSIRVYAARKGCWEVSKESQDLLLAEPRKVALSRSLRRFADDVVMSKLRLMRLIGELKEQRHIIAGVSAPSRASTLIHYTGLDHDLIDCVVEIEGSRKIGRYMPGTRIPVLDEEVLFRESQPDAVIIFSWHIAWDLATKLREKGYKGKMIVPLPTLNAYSMEVD